MIAAQYYEKLDENKVRCLLCPHECLIHPGRVGICYIRQNIKGSLYAISYGRVSATHLDPIEKKPLFHYHPGSAIFSVSGIGCNLGCPYCQNWELAHPQDMFRKQDPRKVIDKLTRELLPEQLIEEALKYKPENNIGIAYTYNEPLIWFEYLLKAAKLAHEHNLKNIIVTNGYLNEKPFAELLPFIDAMNIDIKGFSNEFYHRLGGKLEPVLRLAKRAKRQCHVEITNLLIPGWNTDDRHITELVDWIADNLGSDTPLHFSRYFPARKLALPPTPIVVLKKAQQIALEKLNYVHLGNI